VPATRTPPAANQVTITEEGDFRIIRSNDIPAHKVGRFPNPGNPNEISEQQLNLRLPLHPTPNIVSSEMRGPIGVAVNGVYFDPGTAEVWRGDRSLGWNYEALGGAVRLGLDANYAHVQPGGKYHYHGSPTGYLKGISFSPQKHSPLIGWAIDGFPIYALYGYDDPQDETSVIKKLKTSYRLKSGSRPRSPEGPGGRYDGAFVQDYEFVKGLGDLDDANGRFTKTPEFPDGTYAYFLTKDWPVIPRRLRGTPVETLQNPHGH
jgi:hypothetical protein